MLVVAALVVTMVGIALASWYGGENHAGTTTVTVASARARQTPTGDAVDPAVAAGAHDFVRFACDECHGDQGAGGVSPDVPALTSVAKDVHRRRR